MFSSSRGAMAASILMGTLVALLVTVALMAGLALLLVRFDISDVLLTSLNQVIKLLSIFVGCLFCVGRGGEKGFARGAATGVIYMVAGYLMYTALGGTSPSNVLLACEFSVGALIGALSGALAANLRPAKRAGKTAAA